MISRLEDAIKKRKAGHAAKEAEFNQVWVKKVAYNVSATAFTTSPNFQFTTTITPTTPLRMESFADHPALQPLVWKGVSSEEGLPLSYGYPTPLHYSGNSAELAEGIDGDGDNEDEVDSEEEPDYERFERDTTGEGDTDGGEGEGEGGDENDEDDGDDGGDGSAKGFSFT